MWFGGLRDHGILVETPGTCPRTRHVYHDRRRDSEANRTIEVRKRIQQIEQQGSVLVPITHCHPYVALQDVDGTRSTIDNRLTIPQEKDINTRTIDQKNLIVPHLPLQSHRLRILLSQISPAYLPRTCLVYFARSKRVQSRVILHFAHKEKAGL